MAYDPCRIACHNAISWHVFRDHGLSPNDRSAADGDPFEDHRSLPNPDVVVNDYRMDRGAGRRRSSPAAVGIQRVAIVICHRDATR